MCLESSSVTTGNMLWVISKGDLEFTFRLCVALFSHQKAEGHDLEDTLNGKENSESCVQVLQYDLICWRGRVILKIERGQGLKCLICGTCRIKKWNILSVMHNLMIPVLNQCELQPCTLQIYRLMEDSSRPINSPSVSAPLICRTIKGVIPLGAAATVNEVMLNSSPWTL